MLRGDNNGSILFIHLMEQGLLPVLYVIHQGRKYYDISGNGNCCLFPENEVRNTALHLLQYCQNGLNELNKSAINNAIQCRLLPALLNSGNEKLKLNIFAALLFVSIDSQRNARK